MIDKVYKRKVAAVFKHVPLTLKMLLTTVCVGFIAWAVMDYFQTRHIKKVFDVYALEDLKNKAEENIAAFDGYIAKHKVTAKVIVSQRQFIDYIEGLDRKGRLQPDAAGIIEYNIPPPWLPSSSVLRSLMRFRYALLLDRSGGIMEIFSPHGDPAPESLHSLSSLLVQLSHEQNILTDIDGVPYLISSDAVYDEGGGVLASLMITCPIDEEFTALSMGAQNRGRIVSIIDPVTSTVIASNKPKIMPKGAHVGTLYENYLVTGKSFFDNVNSGMKMEFVSFIPKEDYELLGRSILMHERVNRALSATLLMIAFLGIGIWITKRVQRLSERVVKTSKEQFGIQLYKKSYGDQVDILEKQFDLLTSEVAVSRDSLLKEKRNLENAHEELIKKNWEVDENRRKLQMALDEISFLIQEASHGKGLKVRSIHKLGNCYDLLSCNKTGCPCYGKEDIKCWEVPGTLCADDVLENRMDKYSDCKECTVYKETVADPVFQVGEHFDNMMHILENKNNELEKAYEELKSTQSKILQQEKMASIGQLAAGVAHEINNPIGFITSNLGTLEKYVEKFTVFINAQSEVIAAIDSASKSGELKHLREKLKLDFVMKDVNSLIKESLDGAGRVKTIVQDLKSFSRVDEAMYQHADINECVESTLNIVWNELKYKATVQKDYGELPLTKCYPQQLNQVFMNLLINAAQAIEKQGEIGIRTWNGSEQIHISISDTGNGIPKEKLNRIFEPFFTTKEVGKGTGLGLSITYDIVKKHNGDITLESEEGKGTTFTIKIPVVEGR